MAKKKRRNPILKVLKVVAVVHLLLVLSNLIGDIYSRLGNTHTIAVSGGWNLVVVNRWNELPEDYDIELMELSNGQKIDERIYPYLQEMFDAARAEGIYPIVREGYRTEEEQQAIFDEKVQAYINEGYSRSRAERTAKEWVALPGTSEHQLGIAVDINADKSKCSNNEVYAWHAQRTALLCIFLSCPQIRVQHQAEHIKSRQGQNHEDDCTPKGNGYFAALYPHP